LVAVYVITNLINNKKYVGISKQVEKRWKYHCEAESRSMLHKAIIKYGKDNFKFEHIANAFSWKNACELEKQFIIEIDTKLPNGYNLTNGGDGTPGYRHTKEECERRSQRCPTRNPEIAKIVADKLRGRKRPNVAGEKNAMYGRTGQKSHMLKHIVLGTNIHTGEHITLAGAKEIESAGFNRTHVYACAKSVRKTHKGHTFKFLGETNGTFC
jgi:group I intron endonuclease